MTAPNALSGAEVYLDTDPSRVRKSLGQYFTPSDVAELLLRLAQFPEVQTVLDPMAGDASLLSQALVVLGPKIAAYGIEIDSRAAQNAKELLRQNVRIKTGDAFLKTSWDGIPDQYDLVVANPPYVRYRATESTGGRRTNADAQCAITVREKLKAMITHLRLSSSEDRDILLEATDGVPGNADLSVPSFILCAARVRTGGRLALVFPSVWFSRSYSQAIFYILSRLFDIEYLIEDRRGAWFPNADVRCGLMVARRVEAREKLPETLPYRSVSLGRLGNDLRQATREIWPGKTSGIHLLSDWIGSASDGDSLASGEITLSLASGSTVVHSARAVARKLSLGDQEAKPSLGPALPEPIASALNLGSARLYTLEDLGWQVGQGFRSGANDFFYIEKSASQGGWRSALVPNSNLSIPVRETLPALGRQYQLSSGQQLVDGVSDIRLLYLRGFATQRDMERAQGPKPWKKLSEDTERLIREAERTSYTRGGREVRLTESTAVKTNRRDYNPSRPDVAACFWYQLPPLAVRHCAPLAIPRINGGEPRVILNSDSNRVIDANFSTLWPAGQSAAPIKAMFAIMSSTWVECVLETSATVLGAGALKVEARHLKSLPIPPVSGADLAILDGLGARLLNTDRGSRPWLTARHQVDSALMSCLGLQSDGASSKMLSDLSRRFQSYRTSRTRVPLTGK